MATRLSHKRAKTAHDRSLELRQLHPLIANYFENLTAGVFPLQSSGIPDYVDLTKISCPDDIFARYSSVKPADINPRNLTRAAQLATAGPMEFHSDPLFDTSVRKLIFGIAKVAGVLQSGHHLNLRRALIPSLASNKPTICFVKQQMIEKFATRWLELSRNPLSLFLPEHDREILMKTYDEVNDISHGQLANLVDRDSLDRLPHGAFFETSKSPISRPGLGIRLFDRGTHHPKIELSD